MAVPSSTVGSVLMGCASSKEKRETNVEPTIVRAVRDQKELKHLEGQAVVEINHQEVVSFDQAMLLIRNAAMQPQATIKIEFSSREPGLVGERTSHTFQDGPEGTLREKGIGLKLGHDGPQQAVIGMGSETTELAAHVGIDPMHFTPNAESEISRSNNLAFNPTLNGEARACC